MIGKASILRINNLIRGFIACVNTDPLQHSSVALDYKLDWSAADKAILDGFMIALAKIN